VKVKPGQKSAPSTTREDRSKRSAREQKAAKGFSFRAATLYPSPSVQPYFFFVAVANTVHIHQAILACLSAGESGTKLNVEKVRVYWSARGYRSETHCHISSLSQLQTPYTFIRRWTASPGELDSGMRFAPPLFDFSADRGEAGEFVIERTYLHA
jgi:hypothetical protein